MITIFAYKFFKLILAWYDMWIGLYYDLGHKTLYICPLPMLLLRFQLPGEKNQQLHRQDREATEQIVAPDGTTSCIECESWHKKGVICQRCFH